MTVALLIAVGAWFVTDLFSAVAVFWVAAATVLVILTIITIRDVRRLSKPESRKRTFRWVPVAAADLVVFALILGGASWWLQEQARGPELAEGMWWTSDCCNVDSGYDVRLRNMFPVGTPEQTLLEELARQELEITRGKAVARWWDVACAHFADVEWEVDSGRTLTAIKGDVGSSCL